MSAELQLWLVFAFSGLAAVLALLVWLRKPSGPSAEEWQAAQQQQSQLHAQQLKQVLERLDRLERDMRQDVVEGTRGGRQDVMQTLATFGETLSRQSAEATRTQQALIEQLRTSLTDTLNAQLLAQTQQTQETTRTQNAQLDAFAQQLAQLRGALSETLTGQLQALNESNARRMGEVRATLEAQLAQLQASNATKLDEMRATVDEKLQTTLETRLGQSFKQVADRLEQVTRVWVKCKRWPRVLVT